MEKKQEPQNLLELKPLRLQRWEPREGDLVTVLVPKFSNRWLVRWILPLLAKPDFRVRLDALGSYIWSQCDGALTVQEIAERVSDKFGKETDPDCQRIALFFHRLTSQNLIQLNTEEIKEM